MDINKITLPNDIDTIPSLAEFIDQECEEAGVDMGTTMQMNLAVEEAVVNVMNYAYPKGTTGTVEIGCVITDTNITFTVTDSGVAFDPTAKSDVDTTLDVEERPIGGLGIHLVRQIMDSIAYERTADGHNVLTMSKVRGAKGTIDL